MRFESYISCGSQGKNNAKPDQDHCGSDKWQKKRGGNGGDSKPPASNSAQLSKQPEQRNGKPESTPKRWEGRSQVLDPTHGVFQCPNTAGPAEAKELYEKRTGKRVMKPVLATARSSTGTVTSSPAIPCTIMNTVETEITPDSAAEVSVMTIMLLKQLSASETWLHSKRFLNRRV
ncbi:hypothetical protein PHMEG_00013709 [Phytophthora megakarya]|uniref:Uncharacterized protein n=1 Tax=Phytophthora megakarya TaxID=4795 RepID=A0A225W5M7_9STRA|nr:hypothetical protein PHMEG_00013709 [Phytophthora megakarya]